MEILVDRRTDRCERVPFDAPVELAHDDFEESFEADCVDLSTGGVSLRASCLPEVGTLLVCRLESPSGRLSVTVRGRVVWAHLSGERKGEFGVCFENMDAKSEAWLSSLLAEHLGKHHGHISGAEETPAPAKLMLDGVSGPIAAHVTENRGNSITFEQELPLLEIGRGVFAQEAGRAYRGRIASIALWLDGKTPKLVFEVHREPQPGSCGPRASEPPAEAVSGDLAVDEASDFDPASADSFPPDVDDSALRSPQAAEATPDLSPVSPPRVVLPPERGRPDASRLFLLPSDEDEPHASDEEEDPPVAWRRNGMPWAAKALTGSLGAWLVALGAFAASVWTRTRCELRARSGTLDGQLHALARALRSRLWAGLKGGPAQALNRVFAPALSVCGLKRRRRTTGVGRGAVAAGVLPKRHLRAPLAGLLRKLALPALALGGSALAVYGYSATPGNEPIPLHREVRPNAEPALQLAAVSEPEIHSAAPDGQPVVHESRPASGLGPAAPSAAERGITMSQGRPAFTSDESREQSVAGPEKPSAPALASAAEPVGPRGPVFGSKEVAHGRRFSLRMTNPVRELRGIPDKGGFTVLIPGSLSFDRAGPIAAAHPSVRRSMILNKGDHSALTIRFAEGAAPSYRVAGKGASLEIVISAPSG